MFWCSRVLCCAGEGQSHRTGSYHVLMPRGYAVRPLAFVARPTVARCRLAPTLVRDLRPARTGTLSPSRYAMQTEVACPGIATLALLLSLFCQPLSLLALPCQRMSGPDASAVPAGRYRRLRSAQPLRTYAYRIPFSLRLCGALQPQAKGTLPSANENPATALVGTLASLISTSKNPRFEGA